MFFKTIRINQEENENEKTEDTKKAFADFQIGEKVTIAATTTTAPQLATVVGLGEADAAIIWKENAKADGVEICDTTDLDAYVKVIPAAR